MLLAGLAVALVLTADATARHVGMRRDGRRALSERAMLLATIQGNALSVPMWNLDQDQVGAVLDALTADPDFVSAAVVKPDGAVLQSRLATRPDGTPSSVAAQSGTGPPTVDAEHVIRYVSHGQPRTLGRLRLSLSTTRLDAALSSEIRGRALALLLLVAAVLLSVYGALRQFTRPLEMMATALRRLAAGDRETPIPASDQADEVGEVARALQVFRDTAFRMVRAEGTYRALFENAALGIYGADEGGHVHSANAALLRICGRDPDGHPPAPLPPMLDGVPTHGEGQVGGQADADFYVAPGRGAALLRLLREQGGFVGQIAEIRRAHGGTVWVSQTARAVRDEAGRVLGFAGTVEDVTARLRRQGEERLRVRAAMESAGNAILIVDERGAPLFANPAFVACFGGDGRRTSGGLPATLARRAPSLGRALREGRDWQGEVDIETGGPRDPEADAGVPRPTVPMLIRASAIRDESGAGFGSVVICTDLSDLRRAEAQIAHMAHHDWLTGLPNRVLLAERMTACLSSVPPEGVDFAVLCVDLDRFKAVNDTLGHAAGDGLLKLVAARLRGLVRDGDTVARMGGDEFTLILRHVHDPAPALHLAERLIEELGRPYDLGGREVLIGASVGVALAPLHGRDADQLFGHADEALYEAKSQGRRRVSLFSPEMSIARLRRGALEGELRQAVASHALHLAFQPQYTLATGVLVGAEALLRWSHPTRGPIPPDEFIPIAEEAGLIDALGRWVLATACGQALAWPDGLRVAVNVSPLQFHGRDLVGAVRAVLDETGLQPWRLELEITEGVLMRDVQGARTTLLELKAMGVRIALDDFGTGYSSLSYLRRMPFDKIKVDRSFVAALGRDPADDALVASILALASRLGLETNAEGVETTGQAQRLREGGCQEVQGFLYSPPLAAEDFAALLTVRAPAARPVVGIMSP